MKIGANPLILKLDGRGRLSLASQYRRATGVDAAPYWQATMEQGRIVLTPLAIEVPNE